MQTFHPINPLEEAMTRANQDESGQEAFLQLLMESEVGVMLDKAPLEGGAWDPEATPLVLQRSGGFPALAIFTSPLRAVTAGLQSETYQHGSARPLRNLLRGVQPTLGLVVNPGSLVGFDLRPEQVVELKKAFGVETAGKAE